MGMPAATLTSPHICPKVNPGPVPHVGGPIVTGSGNVFIGGMPAARKGDKVVCVGPPDTINEGSSSVLINGKPAARMGDGTAHGGKIVMGVPTVLIGNSTYNYYDEDRIYGGTTLPCGGRDSTSSVVYKDSATKHKDKDKWRKPVVNDGIVQPLEGTNGKAKKIPMFKEAGTVVERQFKGKNYIAKKSSDGFPEFTIFETYIDDKHLDSKNTKEHFKAGNERIKDLIISKPEITEQFGLSEDQIEFLQQNPSSEESPPGLTWHHHQDVGKMQLVDRELHRRFNHVGGMNIWGGAR